MIKINAKFLVKSLLCVLFVGSMIACSKTTKEAIVEPTDISKAAKAAPVAAKPFPQRDKFQYVGGYGLPNLSATTMNASVKSYYDKWKAEYVKKVTGKNEYIIDMKDMEFPRTTSEAISYGMVITAYMAGYDANAKAQFDGLFAVARRFPSRHSPYLMGWNVKGEAFGAEVTNLAFLTTTEVDDAPDQSATDGDMDIAYALLLADKQWGSTVGDKTGLDYKAEALNRIQALFAKCVNQRDWNLKIGDWPKDPYDTHTRPSDFMPAHIKAFMAVDKANAAGWQKVIDTMYKIVEFQNVDPNFEGGVYSKGLMPDFMVKEGNNWVPVKGKYIESINDGDYSYNSCRVPWRMGTDELTTGGKPNARGSVNSRIDIIFAQNLNEFVAAEGGVANFKAGYYVGNGVVGTPFYQWDDEKKAFSTEYYEDACFTSPLGVVAMMRVGSKNSGASNAYAKAAIARATTAWNVNKEFVTKDWDYFSHTVNMQVLLVMSGNWWTPEN